MIFWGSVKEEIGDIDDGERIGGNWVSRVLED